LNSFDCVIIGAGLSGLVDAILIAETGRSVCVLEQHSIPGGYLQQFKRKKTVFDVGFHYVGSTRPGRPIHQMLQHLQVWDRIRLVPFPKDAAIEVRSGDRSFAYPTCWQRFREKACATWPHERDAIDRLVTEIDEIAARYKWFDLRRDREYRPPLELKMSTASCAERVTELVEDPWLREVLFVQSFNLGLFAHEAPWVKHALAFRSNFDETSRIDGGGGALVQALVERGRELGVDYRFRNGLASVACADRRVQSVTTEKGETLCADLFLAACHPKTMLRLVPDNGIRPMFKERIYNMRDSRGALQVFVRLKAPLHSLDATCLMLSDPREAPGAPPIDTVLVTYPTAAEEAEKADRGGHRLEAMTYMDQAPFAAWRDLPVMRRGPEYEALKGALARRILAMIARIAPELPDAVEDVYVATPLSDEWYTRNEHGGVFGISHDVGQQGFDRPIPRMRLRNLWFSGHSIMMPGICGTIINAFDTCDVARGDGKLFPEVASG